MTRLDKILAMALSVLVRAYQLFLSPVLGMNCRYDPTCSAYALEAFRQHGAVKGGWMAARRIGRCHPWGSCGYDPVPGKSMGTHNHGAGA